MMNKGTGCHLGMPLLNKTTRTILLNVGGLFLFDAFTLKYYTRACKQAKKCDQS